MESSTSEIEKRLWQVADSLRGTVPQHEFFSLALGILFLRHADHQFGLAATQLDEDGAMAELDKQKCNALGCIYFPPQARFARLLEAHRNDLVSEALSRTMTLLESENESLRGILPEMRRRVEGHALLELLRTIADFPVEDDGLAKVFEALLHGFTRLSGQIGWEFATPDELATLMLELVKPQVGMTVYDPCVGIGSTLLAASRYVAGNDRAAGQPLLFGQENNAEALAVCIMRLLVNGVKVADIRLGNTLTSPKHVVDGRLATFDRVVSSPPFSLSQWHHGEAEHDPYNRYPYGVPPRSSADFAFIQHMLASASPKGVVAVLVTHGVLFRGGSEGRIRQGIVEADLIEAVIGLPPGLLYGTEVSAAVLVLNKNKPDPRKGKVLFIDASRDFTKQNRHNCLRSDDVAKIVTTFEAFADVERYARVVGLDEIQSNAFNLNIPRYADSSPLAGLVTQYSQYEKFTLKELATEINSVSGKGSFEERDNAVYVPVTGSKRSTSRLDQLEATHGSYFQVVLCEKAISEYVAQFLRSSVGLHALSILAQGSAVKRISKADLYECMIALPSLDVQKQIITAHQKLTALKDAIAKLDQELSLNPTGQAEFSTQIDSMLAVIGGLSDADYVRRIIREGESKTVEFKQTFSLDIRKQTKEQYIETSALKTLVAFLNSDGGTLLIGIGDDESVVGVNIEIAKFHKDSLDNFLKHFKNNLKSRIGEAFYPFINYRLYDVEGCKVVVVECEPSKSPCFLDGNEFYVRTNPATDKLEGPKFLEYVKHRFES
jgi:type I restriction system adenine methylase HsdM